MKHLFVPYEIALSLKEKGFGDQCFGEYQQWDGCAPYLTIYQDTNEECLSPYTTECIAPLYQQAVDYAYLQYGKLLQYRPDDRELMDREIKEWLESIK